MLTNQSSEKEDIELNVNSLPTTKLYREFKADYNVQSHICIVNCLMTNQINYL